MASKRLAIAALRNEVYQLDPQDRKRYAALRRSYFERGEGKRYEIYPDIAGKKTIGIGFNMDRPEARQEWNEVFGLNAGGCDISFRDVYGGKRKLNEHEIIQLFDYGIVFREKQLKRIYKNSWDDLTLNERLAIEDAYFNGPKLVASATRFYAHITEYAKTHDFKYLIKAVDEIENHSNPQQHPGIQSRRDSQAEMLATYKIKSFQ